VVAADRGARRGAGACLHHTDAVKTTHPSPPPNLSPLNRRCVDSPVEALRPTTEALRQAQRLGGARGRLPSLSLPPELPALPTPLLEAVREESPPRT